MTSRRAARRLVPLAVGVVAAGAVAAALSSGGGIGGSQPNQPVAGQITQLLSAVQVVPRLPHIPGYQRGCSPGQACVFGPAWRDPANRSGCDTRNRILARDLHSVQYKPGTHNCKVVDGWEVDPYTGVRITVHQVQIDHVYPEHRSWDSGAAHWTPQQRVAFANDPDNLLAVSGSANEAKGDMGPGQWLPPNKVFDCQYVVQYLTIAAKYRLPITVSDRSAAISACRI